MASNPVVLMTAASAGAALALLALTGTPGAVGLGTAGPLASALGTWAVVARAHGRAPAHVSGVMIRLFGGKLVLVPLYVVAVVLRAPVDPVPFVASFTCQLVLLYVLEAYCLRRLFAADAGAWRAG